MIKFWIITVVIFIIITYVMHKAFKKYVKGNKVNKKGLWSIYHWEVMVALSSGFTYLILLILKSTHLLTF